MLPPSRTPQQKPSGQLQMQAPGQSGSTEGRRRKKKPARSAIKNEVKVDGDQEFTQKLQELSMIEEQLARQKKRMLTQQQHTQHESEKQRLDLEQLAGKKRLRAEMVTTLPPANSQVVVAPRHESDILEAQRDRLH